jgi:hypothetical protein
MDKYLKVESRLVIVWLCVPWELREVTRLYIKLLNTGEALGH